MNKDRTMKHINSKVCALDYQQRAYDLQQASTTTTTTLPFSHCLLTHLVVIIVHWIIVVQFHTSIANRYGCERHKNNEYRKWSYGLTEDTVYIYLLNDN